MFKNSGSDNQPMEAGAFNAVYSAMPCVLPQRRCSKTQDGFFRCSTVVTREFASAPSAQVVT